MRDQVVRYKFPITSASETRFVLLTFGLESKIKAWFVLDGEVAYLDRNANGNLTEPGERINAKRMPAPEGTSSLWFESGEFAFANDPTRYEFFLPYTSSEKRSALATSWGSMSVPAKISITKNASLGESTGMGVRRWNRRTADVTGDAELIIHFSNAVSRPPVHVIASFIPRSYNKRRRVHHSAQ